MVDGLVRREYRENKMKRSIDTFSADILRRVDRNKKSPPNENHFICGLFSPFLSFGCDVK